MARNVGRRADSSPPIPNWPRPEEPQRFVASADQYRAMYREMVLIRRFEERAGQLYGMGQIGGFCHLYIGQEAVVVGMQAELQQGDSIITGYRDHGHMLACGIPSRAVMAELTGRAAGISRGKGGSMHMFSTEHGFYGGHGIVGAQVRRPHVARSLAAVGGAHQACDEVAVDPEVAVAAELGVGRSTVREAIRQLFVHKGLPCRA